MRQNRITLSKIKSCICTYEELINGTKIKVKECKYHKSLRLRSEINNVDDFLGITFEEASKRITKFTNAFRN